MKTLFAFTCIIVLWITGCSDSPADDSTEARTRSLPIQPTIASEHANSASSTFAAELFTPEVPTQTPLALPSPAVPIPTSAALTSNSTPVASIPEPTSSPAPTATPEELTEIPLEVELISIGIDGSVGNAPSFNYTGRAGAVSSDGRFVAFESAASNLVEDDTNNARDVFIRDRETQTTTRISIAPNGSEFSGDSAWTAMTTNMNVIWFFNNSIADSGPRYVHDRTTGRTRAVDQSELQIADDASRLVFDPATGQYEHIEIAEGIEDKFNSILTSMMSSESRYILHLTGAPHAYQAYVQDLTTGSARKVELEEGLSIQYQALSANGNFFAMNTLRRSSGLGEPGIYVYDLQDDRTEIVNSGVDSSVRHLSVTGDGRFIAIQDDEKRMFVHDRDDERTIQLTSQPMGVELSGEQTVISGDGRFIVFAWPLQESFQIALVANPFAPESVRASIVPMAGTDPRGDSTTPPPDVDFPDSIENIGVVHYSQSITDFAGAITLDGDSGVNPHQHADDRVIIGAGDGLLVSFLSSDSIMDIGVDPDTNSITALLLDNKPWVKISEDSKVAIMVNGGFERGVGPTGTFIALTPSLPPNVVKAIERDMEDGINNQWTLIDPFDVVVDNPVSR